MPAAEELVSASSVAAGLDKLAADLQPLIEQHACTLLGVMTGGMYPLMHLAQRLRGDYLLDYCHATRYAGATRGSDLQWLAKPRLAIQDQVIVIVDDILDEGLTLTAVKHYCEAQGAVAVHTAVLVVKDLPLLPDRTPADFTAGITVPDRYVFGCGMDINERWRHLDAIYALKEEKGR